MYLSMKPVCERFHAEIMIHASKHFKTIQKKIQNKTTPKGLRNVNVGRFSCEGLPS